MNARLVTLLLFIWITHGQTTLSQTPRSGRIQGVVVNAANNLPIPGTRVLLIGSSTQVTTADGNGQFAFDQLDPAGYRLTVSEPGYVRQEYRRTPASRAATVLEVGPGTDIKDVVIRLVQTGTVLGRLTTDTARPAVGVPVQLLKSSFSAAGQRILQSVGTARTDDRGAYRLYWVTPGRYYLVAGWSGASGPTGPIFGPAVSPNVPDDNYGFTFYPGVPDVERATSFQVGPGSEMVLDLPVASAQLFRIGGRVVDGQTGQAPKSLDVTLTFAANIAGGATISFSGSYDPAKGMFSVRPVLSGSYLLKFNGSDSSAMVPVVVTNHMDQLHVVLSRNLSFQGRIILDAPTGKYDIERLRIQLISISAPASTIPSPPVARDGSFMVSDVIAGDYRIAMRPLAGLPDEYGELFVREARFERTDVLEQPFTLTHTTPADATLTVVIGANGGVVEGTALDSRLQPASGAQVVVVPDRNRDRAHLYKTATADDSGRFTIRAIPPGDYRLYAWENLEPYAYFDPGGPA